MAACTASPSTSVIPADSVSADLYQASDWIFLAEGGQHVVCKYAGKALLLQGMLLRFRKCGSSCDNASQRLAFMQQEEEYQRKVVIPLLDTTAHYVIRCIVVHLPTIFVDELAEAISTVRPASRHVTPLRLPSEAITVPAQLLRDACNVPLVMSAAAAAAADVRVPQLEPGSHDPWDTTRLMYRHTRSYLDDGSDGNGNGDGNGDGAGDGNDNGDGDGDGDSIPPHPTSSYRSSSGWYPCCMSVRLRVMVIYVMVRFPDVCGRPRWMDIYIET